MNRSKLTPCRQVGLSRKRKTPRRLSESLFPRTHPENPQQEGKKVSDPIIGTSGDKTETPTEESNKDKKNRPTNLNVTPCRQVGLSATKKKKVRKVKSTAVNAQPKLETRPLESETPVDTVDDFLVNSQPNPEAVIEGHEDKIEHTEIETSFRKDTELNEHKLEKLSLSPELVKPIVCELQEYSITEQLKERITYDLPSSTQPKVKEEKPKSAHNIVDDDEDFEMKPQKKQKLGKSQSETFIKTKKGKKKQVPARKCFSDDDISQNSTVKKCFVKLEKLTEGMINQNTIKNEKIEIKQHSQHTLTSKFTIVNNDDHSSIKSQEPMVSTLSKVTTSSKDQSITPRQSSKTINTAPQKSVTEPTADYQFIRVTYRSDTQDKCEKPPDAIPKVKTVRKIADDDDDFETKPTKRQKTSKSQIETVPKSKKEKNKEAPIKKSLSMNDIPESASLKKRPKPLAESNNNNPQEQPKPKKNHKNRTRKLKKELKLKKQYLEELRLSKTIKKIHDKTTLQPLIEMWKNGCRNAFHDLLQILEREYPGLDKTSLLAKLNVPNDIISND